MLQQTQVVTVIPYYERWLARFPDFATLAAATEQEVLGLWQGLGYYSRARNLHRAAQRVAEEHNGKIPPNAESIRALPGVGRYTAGAVASFAFDLPEPLVDANVARVLARLLDLREPIDGTAGQRALWSAAEALVPSKGAGAFNAALMELGALVCTPRAPQCLLCPIQKHCGAYAAGTMERLPIKKARRKTVLLDEHCAFVADARQVLLEYQPGPRWRGLWKLPKLAGSPLGEMLVSLEYPFTHHRVTLAVYRASSASQLREHEAWHPWEGLEAVPLATPHRRALERLSKLN
jgi:A/G-specific adenine glycosylase